MNTLLKVALLSSAIVLLNAPCMAQPPAPAVSTSIPADAINPNVTLQQACQHGFSASTDEDGEKVRDVASADHKDVYRAAGVVEGSNPDHCINGHGSPYEVDHRISLMIGGTNHRSNLVLQEYCGPYNAHMKDKLELYVRKQICTGKVTLQEGQAMLYLDWKSEYDKAFGKPQ